MQAGTGKYVNLVIDKHNEQLDDYLGRIDLILGQLEFLAGSELDFAYESLRALREDVYEHRQRDNSSRA